MERRSGDRTAKVNGELMALRERERERDDLLRWRAGESFKWICQGPLMEESCTLAGALERNN